MRFPWDRKKGVPLKMLLSGNEYLHVSTCKGFLSKFYWMLSQMMRLRNQMMTEQIVQELLRNFLPWKQMFRFHSRGRHSNIPGIVNPETVVLSSPWRHVFTFQRIRTQKPSFSQPFLLVCIKKIRFLSFSLEGSVTAI